MANLRTNNLSGEQGQNAYRGAVNFGGYVDGNSSDFLSVADHDDFDMGTGDFTFECWLVVVSHAGTTSPNYNDFCASRTYGAGGINPNGVNTIQFVTIAASGNSQDFGDLTEEKRLSGGLSDCHGGLGGF